MDPLDIVLGAIVAAVLVFPTTYLIVRRRYEHPSGPTKKVIDKSSNLPIEISSLETEKASLSTNLVANFELGKAKREIKTLILEKELLSGAITRVYEAEASGKITREEREKLSSKYRDQLKIIETRLGNVSLVIEVGDLENLRNELVNLFERKIGQIEARLKDSKVKLDAIKGITPQALDVIEQPKVEEKKVERKRRPAESETDEKVKALRDEVLDALARLEQMDIEG